MRRDNDPSGLKLNCPLRFKTLRDLLGRITEMARIISSSSPRRRRTPLTYSGVFSVPSRARPRAVAVLRLGSPTINHGAVSPNALQPELADEGSAVTPQVIEAGTEAFRKHERRFAPEEATAIKIFLAVAGFSRLGARRAVLAPGVEQFLSPCPTQKEEI